MKIVNLVGGDRRSPEQSKSYMRKGSLLCRACSPILALHHTVVGCRAAECDPISLIVGTSAREGTAPRDSTLEMVDMRGFKIGSGRLVVAAVLVQPRNRVRIGPTVRGGWAVGQLESRDPGAK